MTGKDFLNKVTLILCSGHGESIKMKKFEELYIELFDSTKDLRSRRSIPGGRLLVELSRQFTETYKYAEELSCKAILDSQHMEQLGFIKVAQWLRRKGY